MIIGLRKNYTKTTLYQELIEWIKKLIAIRAIIVIKQIKN